MKLAQLGIPCVGQQYWLGARRYVASILAPYGTARARHNPNLLGGCKIPVANASERQAVTSNIAIKSSTLLGVGPLSRGVGLGGNLLLWIYNFTEKIA